MYCCTCKERAVSGHGKAGAQNESADFLMVVLPISPAATNQNNLKEHTRPSPRQTATGRATLWMRFELSKHDMRLKTVVFTVIGSVYSVVCLFHSQRTPIMF